MARDDRDRQPAKTKTLGVRVTEREWRTINDLARRRGTSVDALLRTWGVRPLLEMAEEETGDGQGPGRADDGGPDEAGGDGGPGG